MTLQDYHPVLAEVRACTLCAAHLAHGVRPVLQLNPNAKILIVGQAPGRKVHETGIPFNDASGDRLRSWLGISREVFYNEEQIAIVPMGFCFPGTGKSGDLPPRSECEITWGEKVLALLPNIEFTIVLGKYAQAYHFRHHRGNLTQLVQTWQHYWPDKVPLPHPSPRNNIWLRRNPWFEAELLPELRQRVHRLVEARASV